MVKKKLVLIGDSAVGKTSLIRRYVIDEFHDHYIETIGTKISRKDIEVEVDGKEYSLNLQIWDVLGQKAYSSVQSRAFVGMEGALVVADITRKETLDSIANYWLPALNKVVVNPRLVFLANKMDLMDDAKFTMDELTEISSKYAFSKLSASFLTSAKTGENVEDAFINLSKMMLKTKEPEDPTKDIFEDLIAERAFVERDKSSLKGIIDTIITDFCRNYEDENIGMEKLRELFIKAGVSISHPTKENMYRAIDYLAEEESKFLDSETVFKNKEKWMRMIRDAVEEI